MKIRVTQEHINRGQRQRIYLCPVALALQEKYPNTDNVWAGTKWARVGRRWYRLPTEAREFIQRFDFGRKVEPFDFEIGFVARFREWWHQ